MQIVIDIDEEDYEGLKRKDKFNDRYLNYYEKLIVHGTPLPKGHGDLVDISPYKGKVICSRLYSGVKKLIEVDSIEPIIESDKE